MVLSPVKLLRRYTPPTCTLELWTVRSQFARWFKPGSSQDWQFELKFDDPRLPEDQQISIKGDRAQLDLLCDLVGGYLQNFLQATRRGWATTMIATGDAEPTTGLMLPPATVNRPHSLPHLQAIGLLSHELHFGSLAQQASKPTVTLATSQLFDLTNALEDYREDVPLLLKPTTTHSSPWLLTGGIAIALGLLSLIFWQEKWGKDLAPTALNPNQNNAPPSPNLSEVIPRVPLPPDRPLPSPSLAPNLATRDPLPLPPSASPGNPLQRQTSGDLANPGLRVLPPPPVVPPAPPLPPGATSTVGRNPIADGTLTIPTQKGAVVLIPSQRSDSTVSPLKRLPPPPALQPNPSSSAIAARPEAQELNNNAIARRSTVPQQTLLDVIPQIAEVRVYFQQRWQKKEDVKQTLEYRLTLKTDGSLARVVPLGKAAAIYQSQVGMPSLGQVFVSRLNPPEARTVRLVLNPDGTVGTFLDD